MKTSTYSRIILLASTLVLASSTNTWAHPESGCGVHDAANPLAPPKVAINDAGGGIKLVAPDSPFAGVTGVKPLGGNGDATAASGGAEGTPFYMTAAGQNLDTEVAASQWAEFCEGTDLTSPKTSNWRKGKCASLSLF